MGDSICPECGRDLSNIPDIYRPYVHNYVSGYDGKLTPCIVLPDWVEEFINKLEAILCKNLTETVNKVLDEQSIT